MGLKAFRKEGKEQSLQVITPTVPPTGILRELTVLEVKPSANNPRALFDPEPLSELKKSIREHGVLVPITVYPIKGQNLFSILDGERRYRCCLELQNEGIEVRIPANIVEPPNRVAGLLYMFSIHNFREQWELMPTALSLKIVMSELGENDTKALCKLTGLSEPQIERCKKLLSFPEKFQALSLDPDPQKRIPSNFWIEAYPFLEVCNEYLPDLISTLGRDGITERLVQKYRDKKIKSVIHFRRILEALDLAENDEKKAFVVEIIRQYILDPNIETRQAFDPLVVDPKRVQTAVKICSDFTSSLNRLKLEHAVDKAELSLALVEVKKYIEQLILKLEGTDPPIILEDEEV